MSGSVNGIGGFKDFNDRWYEELNRLLHKLRSALNQPMTEAHHRQMGSLLNKVKYHYGDYYETRSDAIQRDVFGIFCSPWTSNAEKCLQWIGRWRPTTVFHVVYNESSIEFEYQILDIIQGLSVGNLRDLSYSQLSSMSELQCETVTKENSLTNELSLWQEGGISFTKTCSELNVMIPQLVSILQRADKLRLNTITKMVDILTPQQAVELMIATIELELGLRIWGMNMDFKNRHA